MRANEKMKKVLSILLCLCMLAQNFPVVAFAAAEDNLCEHHPVHTPECHYAEAVEGSPCTHDHDDSCGYAEKVEEVLCACEATDENGALVHTEGCGYVAPVEGSDCTHVHDGSCGYVEAVEAHDCHYECAECAAPASEEPSEESSEPAPVCNCGTDDPAIHAVSCAVYVAPENPQCYCVEKCTEVNVWCDVCGFDYTKCGGTDRAVGYSSYELEGGNLDLDSIIISTSGEDENVKYRVLTMPDNGENGTVSVCGHNGVSGDITIPGILYIQTSPSSSFGFIVTEIAEDAFKDCSGLTSVLVQYSGDPVSIWDTEITIGDGAFKGTQVSCATHRFTDSAACDVCDYVCGHAPSENAVYTVNDDGNHSYTCTICSHIVTEDHTIIPETGECICGVNLAVAYVVTSGRTYFDTVENALAACKASDDSRLVLLKETDELVLDFWSALHRVTLRVDSNAPIGKITVKGDVALVILDETEVSGIHLESGQLVLEFITQENFHKCTVTASGADTNLTVNIPSGYIICDEAGNVLDISGNTQKIEALVHSNKFSVDNHDWTGVQTSHVLSCFIEGCGVSVRRDYSYDEYQSCQVCGAKQPYAITVNPTANGTVTADRSYAYGSEPVTLTVVPADGYAVKSLEVVYQIHDGAEEASIADHTLTPTPVADQPGKYTFTMPNANVYVNAAFAVCDHSESEHTTANDVGEGKHSFTCTVCGGTATEDHTYENGSCVCGAEDPAVANPVLDISKGNITVEDGKITQSPEYESQLYSGVLTITGNSSSNTVTVNSGNHNIVLDDCGISSTQSAAFAIADGATVALTLKGTNTLSSGANHAGLEVPEGAALVINGSGNLTATGGASAAGIGSGCGENGGTITINSGTVTAKGGQSANSNGGGAGIGGGANTSSQPTAGGTITINGGFVTATGGAGSGALGSGAGIGGGGGNNRAFAGTCGNVTITGGTVIAAAGTVANLSLLGFDIGRGGSSIPTQPNTGTVTITGGNIKAPKVFPMPKDADGNALSLVTITLAEASAGDKPYRLYSGDNEIAYNISGSELLDTSKLYVYLPVTDDTPAVSSVVAGAYRYHKSEDPWDGSSSSGYSATFTKETVQYAYADVRVDSVVSPLRFTYQAAAFSGSDQLLGTFTYYNGNESSVTLTVETNDDGLDFHGSKSISIPMGSSKDINITLLSVNEDALVADQYAQVGSIRVMLGTELLAEVPVEVKLVQVLPEGTPPTAQTLTYSGEAQELITAGTTEEKAEAMQYSLDNQNWGTAIPTATNAGTYTVYYKVPGNLYFTEVTATDVNVTILPKEVTAPTFEDIHVNSIEPLEITFKLMDGDTEIPASEYTASCIKTATPGTATITVTDKDGGNYTVSGTTTTPYCDHSGHDGAYDIVEDTHSFTCSVCGTSVTEEPHTFTDGICKCDTRATYTVTVTESDSEGGNPYLTNTDKATHGVQFSTFIKMGQDADAWYTDVVKVTVDGRELVKNVDYSYQPTLVQLIIYDTSVTGPIEIFAKVNAKVTFQLNGGDVESGRKEQLAAGGLTVTDGKIDMPLAYGMPSSFGSTVEALNQIFLREGYRCTGLKNGDAAADLDAPVKNCTLTVQWEANTYSVTWIADGETHATTDQVYDAALVLPEAPAKTGFIFDGWYTAAEGGDPVTAQTVYRTAGESTYYAHWTECNHSGNTSKPADAGEGKHSFNCSVCSETVTENHSLDSATGKCGGCETDLAVAKVTSGGVDTYHETLASALTAAKSGDTVTLCANVDMGTTGHTISAGVTFCGGEYSVSGNDAGWLHNNGTIESGEFKCTVENMGTVTGGTFTTALENFGTVTGGSFEGISCQSGATLSGAVEFKTLNYMSGCAVDLSEATPGGATIINGTNQELAAGSLKLPEGYALELNGNVVSSLPALDMGMIVPHSHTYETKNNDTHHWTACACGKTTEEVEHSFTYTANGDNHTVGCSGCGYTSTEPHSTTADGDSAATCASKAYCSVCESYYGEVDTTNHDSSVQYDDNGFCPNGCYEPATLNAEGCYEIGNGGQLFWFAQQVGSGNTVINGKLTADIDLENRAWTPIGTDDNRYEGIFDGNGKTISRLCFNDSTADNVGLFGKVNPNGQVKAVTLTDSSITGGTYVGGIVGYNVGTVTGCVNNAVVSGDTNVGGIAGFNSSMGTVELCGNTGKITAGSNYAGGIVGRNLGTIRNCCNTGDVYGKNYAGGITGYNSNPGTVEYCWSAGEVTAEGSYKGGITGHNYKTIQYCYATQSVGYNASGGTSNNVGTYTATQFASGQVAYLLSQGENSGIWGQTIGENGDAYPVLGGATVYQGYDSCAEDAVIGYTNDPDASGTKPDHSTGAEGDKAATCANGAYCHVCAGYYGEVDKTNHDSSVEYEDGFCPNGCYEPAVLNGEVYEISNAGQLYWFADKVNGGETGINGKLMANIVVNEGTMTADSTNVRDWTPIGNEITMYVGTFDGGEHTISGLYFNDSSASDVGLFGYLREGTIKNLGIINSYFCGNEDVGGVVGFNNRGTITNCHNSGTVTGNKNVGGVVGDNNGGTMTNCHNSGTVTGDGYVGGVVGGNSNGSIENCYNTGTVIGTDWNIGGVVGRNFVGTIKDSYNDGSVTGVTLVGGVVGNNNDTVTNCYNTGTVSGTSTVGGVTGNNTGTIEGCYNSVSVSGSEYVGGVTGINLGTIEGCYNSGSVSGSEYIGGIVGKIDRTDSTVKNCYNTGTVIGDDLYMGGVVGDNSAGTVTNCYYLDTAASGGIDGADVEGQAEAKTDAQFASGEVTYLLNGDQSTIVFKQTIGDDAYPSFTGAQVYYGYDSCAEDAEIKYTNEETASEIKPEHAGKIIYTLTGDGAQHIAKYECCSTTVTEDHTLNYTANGNTITESCSANCGYSASLTLKAPANLVYDRTEKAATVEGEIIADYELTYSADAVIMAGDYTATLTVGDYSVSLDFTIAKADPDVVTPSDLKATYGQTLADVELPGGWAWKNSSASVGSVGSNTFAAIYTPANIGNFNTLERDLTVVVAKAMPTVTAPVAADDLVYNGTARTLITAGTATGGTMQYSLDGSTWSETIPTGKDAKTYTVYYKVVGDGNYNDADGGTVSVTIDPKVITNPVIEGIDAQYPHTGSAITPVPTAVKDGNTVIDPSEYTLTYENNINEGTATLKIVDVANGNYTISGSKTFQIVVHAHVWNYSASGNTITATCNDNFGTCPDAEQSFTLNAPDVGYSGNPVEAEVTRDGTDLTFTLHYTGTNYDSADAPTSAGDYTVTMTVGDKSVSDTFTISPKDISKVASCQFSLTEISFVYSGKAPVLNVTGVDSSVGSYTMQEGTDYTVGTVQVNAGSHKLTVTGIGNYTGTVKLDYTITAREITPTVEGVDASCTYTGQAIQPTVTVKDGNTVLVKGNDYDVSYGENKNVGTGTVTVTLKGNYTGEKKITFTILPKGVPDPTIELSFTSAVYTGGEIKPEVTVKDEDTVIPASEYTVSYTGNVNAGTATVTITDKEGGNYAVRGSITFEITKAAAVVTAAPTPQKTLTYTGVAQNLINGGKATGGEMQYSTDNQNWSTDIPQGTATGEYTVYYKVVGDENHSDTAVDSVEVTIAKAQAVITVDTTTITVTYGDTVNLPKATTNFGTVVCDKTADDLVNAGTYTVTYTVAGTENFEGATKTLTVKVEQLAVAEPTVTGTYTYTGKELTAQLTGVESYMTVASGNKGTNADNYEVVITLDGNHKWAEGSDGKVQWTIAKAKAEISVNTDPITITYGETVTLPNATTNFGDVVCNKKASDIVNAGTYTVTYTVAGTDNYDGDTKSITVIVNAKVITVTADALSKTYGDADPKLTYKVEGLVNGDELTGELKRVAGENVGSYAIEQNTLTAGDNYTITFTGANLTINAKAITEADVELNGSLTYTGKELTQPITVTEGITYTVIGDKATNVGTYVLTVQGTGNYTGEVKLSWSIKETAAVVTKAPAAKTLTYTGEAQELITAGEAKGGTMQYQVNGSVWSEEIPTAMDEGSYTVSYKVVGDSNHTDTEPVTLTVVIGKCTHSGNVNKDDNDCTTGVLCSVCDDVLVVTKTHVWGDWTVIKEPTTTKEGSKERPCTNDGCQVKDTLPIPMLNEVEIPDIDGGDITVDNDTPATGDDVTITVTPDPGKEVEKVTVKDETGKEIPVTKNDDGTYTYEQPDGNATVGVVLKDKVYTVTWIADGKTHAKTQYKYGETITAPADPIKEQSGCTTYNFDKWNGLTSGMTMPDNESLTFTAVFAEGESHTDSNSDHKCDRNCGKEDMGIHEDADQDHKCDYGCDKAFGEHKDAQGDGDHACDYGCGEPVESACVPGTAVRENEEEPTCEKAGSYDSVIDCTECGKELSRETVTVEAIGHAWDDGKVTKKATCTENGEKIYTCGNDKSHTRSESIPATGHAYTDEWDTACDNCGKQRIIETTPMYRMYNPNTGEHFYTGSVEERENLVSAGWNYEGVGWNAPVYIGKPVYRFYNPYTGDHHYTMDADECAAVKEAGWVYEGVAWNSASEKGVPQYRLYNPYAVTGTHNYTSSEEERDHLISLGWIYEGIGWYGMRFQ